MVFGHIRGSISGILKKKRYLTFVGTTDSTVYASLKRSHKHWQMMQPKETKRFSSQVHPFSLGLFLMPRFLLRMFTEKSQVSFYSYINLCDIWRDCQTPSLHRISVWNLQNLNFCRRYQRNRMPAWLTGCLLANRLVPSNWHAIVVHQESLFD